MISYIVIGVLLMLISLQAWWIFRTIKKFWAMESLFSEIYQEVTYYVEHIRQVNQLEKYYGDETLNELLEHGESTGRTVEEFLDIFSEFSEFDTEEAATVDGEESTTKF